MIARVYHACCLCTLLVHVRCACACACACTCLASRGQQLLNFKTPVSLQIKLINYMYVPTVPHDFNSHFILSSTLNNSFCVEMMTLCEFVSCNIYKLRLP